MKTQIMLVTLIAFALMFAIMPMAFAEESNSTLIINNDTLVIEEGSNLTLVNIEGELELNETVSSGNILGQEIKNWFTFNKEKKMDGELKLARLRLIQANIAAKNNNSEAMEKALEAHERIMNKIQERMNKNESDSNIAGLNSSAVKLIGLQRAIQVHELRVEYLQNVLADANLTDEQREKLEAKLEKAQNNTAHLVQVSEDKQEVIKTKLMTNQNLTEEQAEEIMEQKQEKIEQKLEQSRERQEEIRDNLRENRQQIRNNSVDSDESEDEED